MRLPSVSILGCGWLGEALMIELIDEGFTVKGSKSTPEGTEEFRKRYPEIYYVSIEENGVFGNNLISFFNSDVLVINIPPGRDEDALQRFPELISQLLDEIDNYKITHVLFVSSTSVYPENNLTVDESYRENPDSLSGKILKECESMILNNQNFNSTIIRFGGLIGYDRKPGKFLAGRENISNGNAPVNLIHRDDCIEIIKRIILKGGENKVYNAVAPSHPSRKEFYTFAASKQGFDNPHFSEDKTLNWKIVSSQKLISELDYDFIHADLMNEEMFSI